MRPGMHFNFSFLRQELHLVTIAELVKLRRNVSHVLEGVDDDVVDVVAPHDDIAPVAQPLVVVGSAQAPRLQDVLRAADPASWPLHCLQNCAQK